MSDTHQLHRRLRLFDAAMLVVGSMIGSGIFFVLSYMAQQVETPGLLLGLWAFGGLFTVLKVVALAALIVAGLCRPGGGSHFFPSSSRPWARRP